MHVDSYDILKFENITFWHADRLFDKSKSVCGLSLRNWKNKHIIQWLVCGISRTEFSEYTININDY